MFNVPVYYFRDYYRYIENYRKPVPVRERWQVPLAGGHPGPEAASAYQGELDDFLSCKVKDCEMKLSADEIAMIPQQPDMKTDAGREDVADAYRKILMGRLSAYQVKGWRASASTMRGQSSTDLKEIADAHLLKFDHLEGYFPGVTRYLNEYPAYKDRRIDEFFYWSREHLGNKPVIAIRHVITRRIGEDYLVVSRLIYSSHYYLFFRGRDAPAQLRRRITPWTLFVFEQRTLTDRTGSKASAGIFFAATWRRPSPPSSRPWERKMETRYKSRSYTNFPFGLLPRDQR